MPKRSSKKKTEEQRDHQQMARDVLDAVAPDAEPEEDQQDDSAPPEKNPAAVALGRMGGVKGGPARAKKLTAKKRSEIARKAARARWKKKSD